MYTFNPRADEPEPEPLRVPLERREPELRLSPSLERIRLLLLLL